MNEPLTLLKKWRIVKVTLEWFGSIVQVMGAAWAADDSVTRAAARSDAARGALRANIRGLPPW